MLTRQKKASKMITTSNHQAEEEPEPELIIKKLPTNKNYNKRIKYGDDGDHDDNDRATPQSSVMKDIESIIYESPNISSELVFDNTSSSTSNSKISIVTEFSDDVLIDILLSGYFTCRTVITKLSFVCKRFHDLIKNYMSVVDARSFRFNNFQHSLKSISTNFPSLQFLDFSYVSFQENKFTAKQLLPLQSTLRGLSLRCTDVSDKAITNISQLSSLQYLDLSKSKYDENSLLSGTGLSTLSNLRNLLWLNLACTCVSDAVLRDICKSNPKLMYLGLSGCRLLTNDIGLFLRPLRLLFLDISNCASVDRGVFKLLFGSLSTGSPRFYRPKDSSNNNNNISSVKQISVDQHSGSAIPSSPTSVDSPFPMRHSLRVMKCNYMQSLRSNDLSEILPLLPRLEHFEAVNTQVSQRSHNNSNTNSTTNAKSGYDFLTESPHVEVVVTTHKDYIKCKSFSIEAQMISENEGFSRDTFSLHVEYLNIHRKHVANSAFNRR